MSAEGRLTGVWRRRSRMMVLPQDDHYPSLVPQIDSRHVDVFSILLTKEVWMTTEVLHHERLLFHLKVERARKIPRPPKAWSRHEVHVVLEGKRLLHRRF